MKSHSCEDCNYRLNRCDEKPCTGCKHNLDGVVGSECMFEISSTAVKAGIEVVCK